MAERTDRATHRAAVIRRSSAALLSAVALACHAQPAASADAAIEPAAPMTDARDPRWRDTRVADAGTGVVQYTGDAAVDGGMIAYLTHRLAGHAVAPSATLVLKTADIRLSLPNVRVGWIDVMSPSAKVSLAGTLVSAPVTALLSAFEKNKSASAVICLSIDGVDYLGNDARLFRFGAESELRGAIEVATQRLLQNIDAHRATDSPACAAGWEGGQPREDDARPTAQ